jgi:hypothetical protein
MASIAYITEKVWSEHREFLLKDLESFKKTLYLLIKQFNCLSYGYKQIIFHKLNDQEKMILIKYIESCDFYIEHSQIIHFRITIEDPYRLMFNEIGTQTNLPFEIVENEEYIFHCNTLKIRNGIIIFYSNEYRDIPEGTMTYFNKINDFYMQCTIDQLKAAGDY